MTDFIEKWSEEFILEQEKKLSQLVIDQKINNVPDIVPNEYEGETVTVEQDDKSKGISCRNWCFTLNNPTVVDFDNLCGLTKNKDAKCNFVLFELEVAKSGTQHYQGYLEFKQNIRYTHIKKIFPTMHVACRRGTQGQAMSYCLKGYDTHSKDANNKGGSIYCFGKCHKDNQGCRNDLVDVLNAMKPFMTITRFMEENNNDKLTNMLNTWAKYPKFIEKYQRELEKKQARKRREVEVEIYYGESRSGKSRKAFYAENNLDFMRDDVFKLSVPKDSETIWYDGYEGETTLVLEEFYGNLPYNYMLELLEGNFMRLPVKGGFTYANWTKVIIISNQHPSKWYRNIKDKIAFKNRVKRVMYYLKDKEPEDVTQSYKDADIHKTVADINQQLINKRKIYKVADEVDITSFILN